MKAFLVLRWFELKKIILFQCFFLVINEYWEAKGKFKKISLVFLFLQEKMWISFYRNPLSIYHFNLISGLLSLSSLHTLLSFLNIFRMSHLLFLCNSISIAGELLTYSFRAY
jgi:hypothetical protein